MSIYNSSGVLLRIFKEYVRPYTSQVIVALFFMLTAASCSAIIVQLIKPAIDRIFLDHNQAALRTIPILIFLASSVKGIAEYYQNYLIKYLGQKILTDIQMQLYNHLLHADLALISNHSAARLISRFTNDISLMRGAVSNLLVGCAKHFLSVLFLLIVMIRLEPTMTLLAFTVFPAAIYPVRKLSQKIRVISNYAQETLASFTVKLDETFRSIKIVRSFQGEKTESQRAKIISNEILQSFRSTAKYDAVISPIMEILSGIAVGGIIWYGGLMVINGKTTTGALFAFITAFVSAYRPYKSLISLNINLQEGLTAAKRVFQMLDTKTTIYDLPDAREITDEINHVEFKNLSFAYDNSLILDKINLNLYAGKITAIVGRSGSGKSTLTNLLIRFFDPTSGKILINNEDCKKVTLNSLRSKISLVTQDSYLFNVSVKENIAYGQEFITEEKIIQAARWAGADEFIQNLPNKYDTVIGEQGHALSGGQKQRISIARAFLKDSPILVLDEATSALDPSTEIIILESLQSLKQDKIILLVSHRLTNIKMADNIVVLKNGEIQEQGSYDYLLSLKGEFYNIYSNSDDECYLIDTENNDNKAK